MQMKFCHHLTKWFKKEKGKFPEDDPEELKTNRKEFLRCWRSGNFNKRSKNVLIKNCLMLFPTPHTSHDN